MHFTHKIKYRDGFLAIIKPCELGSGKGIAELKCSKQKTVYSTSWMVTGCI